jgi:hypothetical protein
MPELTDALLADYVRTEGGVAHLISAGIDTVQAPAVPTGQNVGFLLRATFTRNECGRPHRLEVIFQDIDGQRLVHVNTVFTPEWNDDLPVGWRVGMQAGFNFGIPLPSYGVYSFEILIDDAHQKTLNLRVIPQPGGDEDEDPVGDANV